MTVKSKSKKVATTTTTTKGNTTNMVAQQMGALVKAGGGDMAQAKKKGDKTPRCKGDPVSVATGAVVERVLDVRIRGGLIPVEVYRQYSSLRADERGPLGRGGWTHNYHQWVALEGERAVLHGAGGSETEFDAPERGESSFDRGSQMELRRQRDGVSYHVYSLRSRRTRIFAPIEMGGPALLQAITDNWGNRVTLTYNGSLLSCVTDTAGREIRFINRDSRVRRLEVWAQDKLQDQFEYRYSDAGELASATNSRGLSHQYGYDGVHRMVHKTMKNGTSFYYEYDQDDGRCVQTWGDGGLFHVELEYDDEAFTTTTHGEPQPRVFHWDERGLVLKEESFDGDFAVEYEYDDDQLLIKRSNAVGEVTAWEHDERGHLVSLTNRAGNTRAFEWAGDQLVREVCPDGRERSRRFDQRGTLVEFTDWYGQTYSYSYDPRGRRTTLHGPDGLLETREYDDAHNVVRLVDVNGHAFEFTYDALSRQLSDTDPFGHSSRSEFDSHGELTTNVHADGETVGYSWDAHGNPTEIRRSTGSMRMEYIGTGVLSRLVKEDGSEWRFGYDREEKPIWVENPKGERYEFQHDAVGRISEERTFDGRTIKYSYSRANRLARTEYPDGSWRSYSYDPMGALLEEDSPHGKRTYERDAFGRLIATVVDEDVAQWVVTYERNVQGDILATNQNGYEVRYEYDKHGWRTSRILPDGEVTNYSYDEYGQLTAVEHGGQRIECEHDARMRPTVRRIADNGTELRTTYDARDRVVERTVVSPSAAGEGVRSQLLRRAFSYDGKGRLTQIEDEAWGDTHYEYDQGDRLKGYSFGSHRERFDYDAAGALVRTLDELGAEGRTWETTQGDLLRSTPEFEFDYDACHRRTLKRVMATQDETKYLWDVRGQLRQVELPSGETVRYFYDAHGRRLRKEIHPPAPDAQSLLEAGELMLPAPRVVDYLWDYDELAAEIDSERGTRVFVFEPGTFEPLLQKQGDELFLVVNNPFGLPRELVDMRGEIAWSAVYSAWGKLLTSRGRNDKSGHAVASPFRFLGHYADDETGLDYVRHRYFDSSTARYLSPDPKEIGGGQNLFGFERSPTLQADPWGLEKNIDHPGYIVYAQYSPDYDNGETPYYIGITKREKRRQEHINSGHLVPTHDGEPHGSMVVIEDAETYAQARAYEQAYIEEYDTRLTPGEEDKRGRGKWSELSEGEEPNRCNSFNAGRDDARGKRYEEEYGKIIAGVKEKVKARSHAKGCWDAQWKAEE